MADCKVCGTTGLEWSENIKPETGKHFLFNPNSGIPHNCTERTYCKHPECNKVFPNFEKGWTHMLQNDYHYFKQWNPLDEKSRMEAVAWGVPEQATRR